MFRSLTAKLYGAALLLTGSLAVPAWLVAGLGPPADAAYSEDAAVPADALTVEKKTPLDCRLVRLAARERRAELESHFLIRDWCGDHPGQAARPLYRNPLMAPWVRVEVENTSGRDLPVYAYDGRLFRFGLGIRDAAGAPVEPDVRRMTRNSLKRIGPPSRVPDLYPLRRVEPGVVRSSPITIFDGPSFDWGDLKPGSYFVYGVCFYFHVPDYAECEVLSRPIGVRITEDDIKEWKELSR